MPRPARRVASLALLLVAVRGAAGADASPGPDAGPAPEDAKTPPTLEQLRECLIRRGISPRLVRIEPAEDRARPAGGQADAEATPRRIVLWAKTKRLTQTLVVAFSGGGAYVRVQSCGLATAPAAHPRFAETAAYLLDRNFVMSGAQFARDATDGEIVLRTELPCGAGLEEDAFLHALNSVLHAADEEAPRLWALTGEEPAQSAG